MKANAVRHSVSLVLSVLGSRLLGTKRRMYNCYSYDKFPEHHSTLRKYLKKRNLTETFTIEQYVVTAMDKPDPKDWETNLYYLYK